MNAEPLLLQRPIEPGLERPVFEIVLTRENDEPLPSRVIADGLISTPMTPVNSEESQRPLRLAALSLA